MQYGHFDDEHREYVITRPAPPRPWSNYLGNAEFGGVITNHAAGYIFYRSAAQGRLTRYPFNAVPGHLPGRYVYLRDTDSGDYWSNGWMPVGGPREESGYECRHGTGYTIIRSQHAGIGSEVVYFTPLGARYETWKITVTNRDDQPRRLRVFPFVEPQCNWSADDDTRNLQYTQYIARTTHEDGLIDIGSNVNMPEDPGHFTNKDQKRHTFFGLAGANVSAFDADLASFLGPYGTYARPRAVVEGRCANVTASGDMPAAAFQINLELTPGESRTFACVFGVGEAATAGRVAVRAMADPADIDAALADVRAHWHNRLNTLHVETPDPAFDSMLNTWAPYNNLMTFYWSRAASLVYAGERDGLGYRDTLQDFVGTAALIPSETRERLILMLTGQFSHGGCQPVVQPFNHHPGRMPPAIELRADDGLWLFNAVPTYVKETGESDFYALSLPYADSGEGTVLEHLRRALEFNWERRGAHGLPCGLHADWNDCIRLGEKGETVFVAMQLRYGLREYARITERLKFPGETAWARERLAELDAALDAHAWDGEWYRRAYRFDGMKFGSRECQEGRIFMNPQTWAVLSGAATGERAHLAMSSMRAQLATDCGVMLCAPPYVNTDPAVCLRRFFNPGTKENGGIFNHTQGWAVMAAAELGLGDLAYEYLRNVLPARFNEQAEIREVEPYVVCQSTHSPASPRYGAGRVPWLSGSAVWNHVAMTTAILGIQPDEDGLRLCPCLPSAWPGYRATRRFRGATYIIHARRAAPGETPGLRVDGQPLDGDLIPAAPAESIVEVAVILSPVAAGNTASVPSSSNA